MNEKPFVSVIIPAHNAEATLGRLLESIKVSSYEAREVIVVDDASTDATPDIVRRCGARLIRLKEKCGPAQARNIGAKAARGEVLLFLDSDEYLEKDVISHAAALHSTRPDVAGFQGLYEKKPINRGFFPAYKALVHYFWYSRYHGARVTALETNCGTVRKEVFEEMGGFNTNWCQAEDVELGYRISRKYPIVIDTGLRARHVFPGFWKNAKLYFQRAYLSAPLVLEMGFGGTCFSKSESVRRILGFLAAAAAVGSVLVPRAALPFLGVIFIVYLLVNRDFFTLCASERGLLFTLGAIPTYMVNSTVVVIGSAWGVLRHLFSKRGDSAAWRQA